MTTATPGPPEYTYRTVLAVMNDLSRTGRSSRVVGLRVMVGPFGPTGTVVRVTEQKVVVRLDTDPVPSMGHYVHPADCLVLTPEKGVTGP